MEVEAERSMAESGIECPICGNFGGPNHVDKLHSHYGAVCCLGCKAFFRRSIRENRTYDCKSKTDDCNIDPKGRVKCKKCRFAKVWTKKNIEHKSLLCLFQCLNVGMDPGLVLISKEERKRFTNHRTEKEAASLCDIITQNCTLSWAEVEIDANVIHQVTSLFLDPSSNPNTKQTFTNLLMAYVRHFSNFAAKTPQFTELLQDHQTILLNRNAPLFCHYIMASCLVADTGLEQFTWLLGPYTPLLGCILKYFNLKPANTIPFLDIDEMKNLQMVDIHIMNRAMRIFADQTTFEVVAYMGCCISLKDNFSCPQYNIGVLMFFLLFNMDYLKTKEKKRMQESRRESKAFQQARELLLQVFHGDDSINLVQV